MALQQIQKSSTVKPDMIGDGVEVTVYEQDGGNLHTMSGVLAAYSTSPEETQFKLDGLDKGNTVPREGFTLSITHYEFVLDLTSIEEDGE